MSRGALLTGTAGGIIGAITAAIGIIWVIIVNTFRYEIEIYVYQWSAYLNYLLVGWYPKSSYPPLIYPSSFLFNIYSFVLAIFLIVTCILIGIGFYGTYKIGGGAMGAVGLIFSIIGITLGALLIIMGNQAIDYTYAQAWRGEYQVGALPVPTPNFNIIWIGFIILGVTFIILGSASIKVREMTENHRLLQPQES